MLKELISLANHLDQKGMTKEADMLDSIIKSAGPGLLSRIGDFFGPSSVGDAEIGSDEYRDHTGQTAPLTSDEMMSIETANPESGLDFQEADTAARLRKLLEVGPSGDPEMDRMLLAELHIQRGRRDDVVNFDDRRVSDLFNTMRDAYRSARRLPDIHSFVFQGDHRANTYADDKGRVPAPQGALREHQNL